MHIGAYNDFFLTVLPIRRVMHLYIETISFIDLVLTAMKRITRVGTCYRSEKKEDAGENFSQNFYTNFFTNIFQKY